MLCKNPFVRDQSGKVLRFVRNRDYATALGGVPFPCGQCLPCRINKRRRWTARMMLEHMCHEKALYITLTYSEENLPQGGQLSKRDLQLFFKRLRKALEPRKIRYFACGEYGTQFLRPHYHAIVYGIDWSDGEVVSRAWHLGFVRYGDVERRSIQYVAGYVTKKIGSKNNGLVPEFTLMSRRPAIGSVALAKLASLVASGKYRHLFEGDSDIPTQLRFGPSLLPLDRYAQTKIGDAFDVDWEQRTIDFVRKKYLEFSKAVRENPDSVTPFLDALRKEAEPRLVRLEAKDRMFNRRSGL